MAIKTKKITEIGYLPKSESISESWSEARLDHLKEKGWLTFQEEHLAIKQDDKLRSRKVKVTITMVIEDL